MAPKDRLQALSKQLVEGIPSAGSFEDIPRIRTVAGDPTGPYVPLSPLQEETNQAKSTDAHKTK